ncbi:MAG: MBL fold metallo-hydrolase [Gammaproteobacteria bacterium]|nr:MAG: MBL fold metallo-hydrolase [Gammaproteobacteria bacterium]
MITDSLMRELIMLDNGISLKIVVDNNASDGYLSEHGFSVLIDDGNQKILFDCGQGDAFKHNLAKFKVPLSQINKLILSHGHYDHTGSIDEIVSQSKAIDIYAHPDIFETRYSIHPGVEARDISIKQQQLEAIHSLPDEQKIISTDMVQVSEKVFITGEIPRNNTYEDTGGPFYLDKQKEAVDIIYDDQSVCMDTDKGLVILTGCCHSGIVNTMDHVKALFSKNIYMVIGGLHLVNATQERISRTIEVFGNFGVAKIVPCHCTGDNAIRLMQLEMGEMLQLGYAGMEINI